jgi:NADPH:quinone reductase-like Zn-dependent oxidoreductase
MLSEANPVLVMASWCLGPNLKDIDKPVLKDDEVLVRVRAASVHPDVWHPVRGLPYVLRITGAGLLTPEGASRGLRTGTHSRRRECAGDHSCRAQQSGSLREEAAWWTSYISTPGLPSVPLLQLLAKVLPRLAVLQGPEGLGSEKASPYLRCLAAVALGHRSHREGGPRR